MGEVVYQNLSEIRLPMALRIVLISDFTEKGNY
jgi:hypothetical protein